MNQSTKPKCVKDEQNEQIESGNECLLARVPEAPARWRPNFLMMKLDPINTPETAARINPLRLSSKEADTDIASGFTKDAAIGGYNFSSEQSPEKDTNLPTNQEYIYTLCKFIKTECAAVEKPSD